jgi:hypothetical protein
MRCDQRDQGRDNHEDNPQRQIEGSGSKQAVPSGFSAAVKPTEEGSERVEKQGRGSAGQGGTPLFFDSSRRTRAAEECSAPPRARSSPTTNGAAVGISDIGSRDREAFSPLGMSLRR